MTEQTGTQWVEPDKSDDFYEQEETDRARRRWIEQYFSDDVLVPSARGGLERLDDPPGYYSNGVQETGFRSCLSCAAPVYVYEFNDVDQLNIHRAFHDKLGW